MGANYFIPKNITEVVRKAFKVAETEKPGVTVVEFPEDIAKEEIKDTPIKPTLIRRPAADNRAIEMALNLILDAKSNHPCWKWNHTEKSL